MDWWKQCDKYKGQSPSGEVKIIKKFSFSMKFKVAFQWSQKTTQSNVFAGQGEGQRAIEMNVCWLPVLSRSSFIQNTFFSVI